MGEMEMCRLDGASHFSAGDRCSFENPAFGESGVRRVASIVRHPKDFGAGSDFGSIEFRVKGKPVAHNDSPARFMKVHNLEEKDLRHLQVFARREWRLPIPKLILSITGGAKDFQIPNIIEKAFQNSIHDLVQRSPGIMLTTGGTNTGVMKLVGKAMKNFALTRVDDGNFHDASAAAAAAAAEEEEAAAAAPPSVSALVPATARANAVVDIEPAMANEDDAFAKIACIGIATWGIVEGRDKLAGATGSVVPYDVDKDDNKKTYLDPNHTHFLLVDDGSEGKFGREIEFRSRLEKSLTFSKSALARAPLVNIIIEGGPNSLMTVHESLLMKTPCIVLKGTGRAADVLSEAHELFDVSVGMSGGSERDSASASPFLTRKLSVNREETDEAARVAAFRESPRVREQIERSLRQRLFLSRAEDIENNLKLVMDCMDNHEYLYIFQVVSGRNDEGLQANDLAQMIVDAFLDRARKESNEDREKESERLWQSLVLAFQWNHTEAAKSILEDAVGKGIKFEEDKRVDLFVDALRAKRISFIELFMDSLVDVKSIEDQMYQYLFDLPSPDEISLNERLSSVIGHFWGTKKYYKDQKSNPFNYLFIWAVIRDDLKLARFLLRKVKYPIATCLIACNVLAKKSRNEAVEHEALVHQLHKDEFEEIANRLLNECHATCSIRAKFLLLQEIATLGSTSVLQLALKGQCMTFISSKVCQNVFTQMWYNGIATSTSYWKILAASLCPPLAPLMITFVADGERDESTTDFVFSSDGVDREKRLRVRQQVYSLRSVGIDVGLRRRLSYCDKLMAFFASPYVKYQYNMISYAFLLLFFSSLILNESDYFQEEFPLTNELVVFVFWIHFVMQEILQIVANGTTQYLFLHLRSHVKDRWNLLDLIIIILIFVAIAMRSNPSVTADGQIRGLIIKMLYCFLYMMFWVRLLHVFTAIRFLGPKLVMISRMLEDLLSFLCIICIFGVSYSVVAYTLEASVSHECCGEAEARNISFTLMFHRIFTRPYWNLYGEVGDINDLAQADKNQYFFEFAELILLPGMKGIYMLIAGILLLNLLIAMFSYTFTKIQDQSFKIWCYSRHDLIFEYYDRSKLPAPFAILSIVFRFLRFFFKRFREVQGFVSSKRTIKIKLETPAEGVASRWADEGKWAAKYAKMLRRWEAIVANNFWSSSGILEEKGKNV